MTPSAYPPLTQGDCDIHACQTGTNQQNILSFLLLLLLVSRNIAECARGPGIRDVTLAMLSLSRQPGIAWRKIAESKNHFVSDEGLAAAKMDLRHSAGASHRNSLVLHTFQSGGMEFDFLL